MSSNSTLDRYDTWIDEEDYKTGSTIGVKVCYRNGARIRFDIDHSVPGSNHTVSLIRKYVRSDGMTEDEANSLRSSADKVEETNKIARRMIRQATREQSEEERVSYPIRAYVITEEGFFVDVTEEPQA